MSEAILREPENWVSRLLQKFGGKHIYLNGRPYLSRYYLWGNGLGDGFEVYLHHIQQHDSYRYLHNHPWQWFFSIVLKGYYTQLVLNPEQSNERLVQRVRLFNLFRSSTRYHSISEVPEDGVWTLVIVPKKLRSEERWGYWNEDAGVHVPDLGEANRDCVTVRFGRKLTFN